MHRNPWLPFQPSQPHEVTDTFSEIIGTVVDASTIKFIARINMGPKLGASLVTRLSLPNEVLTYCVHLDLAIVNQVIELTFDPRFKGRLF